MWWSDGVIEKVQEEIDRVIGQSREPNLADRANMPYTEAVIHEIQRLGDIVPLNVLRVADKDTTLGKCFIPKVSEVINLFLYVLFTVKYRLMYCYYLVSS